jgi:1,4-dihydroxy-2-naphthoate octaprenyltransferase
LGFIVAAKDSGVWNWFIFSGVLLACFGLHLNANLANDLFDHMQGVDAGSNIGGSRVIQQGKISPGTLARVIGLTYALVLILAFLGVYFTGCGFIFLIVLFAMFSSFFYVAPPIKYGHRALGEFFVFINMGLVMVTGTYYTLTGGFSMKALALSIPVGLMVAGILYFQSLPEIETDKAAGKNTLANVLGPVKAIFLFKLWWPAVWTLLLMLWITGICSWLVLIGISLSIPAHLRACRMADRFVGDWLGLDAHGWLVRFMYLACGLFLIFAIL